MMLAGFVSGLTVLLLLASLFASPEINSDMLEAKDDELGKVATQAEERDFDTFVENANVEQLVKTLRSLQDVPNFKTESVFLTNLKRRQMIANSLLAKPLSDEHRRLAILTQLNSKATLFWTDQFKAVGEADLSIGLREVAQTHADDSDPEIAFESRIQLAKLNSQVAVSQAANFGEELHKLLADFPTNKRVQKTIKNSLNFLVSTPENRAATIKVLNHFFKLPRVSGNQETEDLYTLLRDLEILCELEFFDTYEMVQFTGEAGRDRLRDVCLDLSEVPTAGTEVQGNLDLSARWMESNGHYQHATEIYDAVKSTSDRLTDPSKAATFLKLGNWGSKRCEAVGKPFNLATNLYDGKPMKLSVLDSMPVLIVFWSKADKTDSILFKIETASRRWRKRSVKIIAVQVEKEAGNFSQYETSELKKKYPTWSFCYDDGSGTGPIFSQVPSTKNGRMVLLDRQHKLYDVDVSLEELVTSVNSILATRTAE